MLRRLLRRSIRSMRLLGVHDASFPELFAASRDAMAPAYPEILREYGRVSSLAIAEEESFLGTLEAGTTILDTHVEKAKKTGDAELSGDVAFLLHDTYGFPIDLTLEMADEAGLGVDQETFTTLMAQQRTRAKEDAKSKKSLLGDLSVYREFRGLGETVFCGYDELVNDSTVLGLIRDGVSVQSVVAGESAEVILRETSLYAESGGQVADRGYLVGSDVSAQVHDVQKPVSGLISHRVTVDKGELTVGSQVRVEVDVANRREARQAHSATHLIHAALRDTLGSHATQAGSLNRPGYMRLDFSWTKALSDDQRSQIEVIANQAVADDLEVTTKILAIDDAKAAGAMALFGEKYGDVVRMVDIGGPWSRELCAGTHVERSSQIGAINLVGENSVSAGARRVEALVGVAAVKDFSVEREIVGRLSELLKTPREDIPGRVGDLVDQVKTLEKTIVKLRQAAQGDLVPGLVGSAETLSGRPTVIATVTDVASADDLRTIAQKVANTLGESSVVVLASVTDGRVTLIAVASLAAQDAGVDASALVKTASKVLGGGGGGKPGLAQGGGPDAAQLEQALTEMRRSLTE